MPRRRPSALRAQREVPRLLYAGISDWGGRFPRSWRLSPRTVSAIHREEYRRPYGEGWRPGTTRDALTAYRNFLALPGRYVYLRLSICGCEEHEFLDNVAVARDLLEVAVHRLPPRPRRELEELLARLDAELRRRTLPDPFAYRQAHRRGGWWHWRLYDETSHL